MKQQVRRNGVRNKLDIDVSVYTRHFQGSGPLRLIHHLRIDSYAAMITL